MTGGDRFPSRNDRYDMDKNTQRQTSGAPKAIEFHPAVIGLREAIESIKALQHDVGRGPGGREVALAVTNAEQAYLWLREGEAQRPTDVAGA